MNKRRLLKLAELLEKNAKSKTGPDFNMGNWAIIGEPRRNKTPWACGTSACALGLAAISGKFKCAGLFYRVKSTGIALTYKGRRSDEFEMGKKVFDLTEGEAAQLFLSKLYAAGPHAEIAKAKEIRNLVKEQEQ